MRKITLVLTTMLLFLGMILPVGCTKQNDDVKVNTYTPQEITESGALCGVDVVVAEGMSLNEIGICWGTVSNPTTSDSHESTTNWTEPFTYTIAGLEPNTEYHVRAYALLGSTVYYGEDKSFVTLEGGGNPDEEDEYIDLGLPSGILWASCNVGADKPEAFGNFFAWGEIAAKATYDWSTYNYWNGSQVTKYTGSDDLFVLLSEDDVAVAELGDDWRIPTKEEWEELLSNCEESWTTRNGVNGRLFIGPNGKSIFLPAAGYYNNSTVSDQGHNGRYWSSSLYADNTLKAWRLLFQSSIIDINAYDRCFGQSIRAVRDLR